MRVDDLGTDAIISYPSGKLNRSFFFSFNIKSRYILYVFAKTNPSVSYLSFDAYEISGFYLCVIVRDIHSPSISRGRHGS